MNNIIVSDTLEVFLENLTDGGMYFFGATSESEIAKKMNSEYLRGGIGAFVQGVIKSQNDMTAKVTPLVFSEDVIGLQMGSDFASGTKTVKKSESDLKVASGKVTITGTAVGTNVDIFDSKGKKYVGTNATGTVTITSAPADGTIVTAVYDASVTGNYIDLRADKFPLNYKLHLHGIAYDIDTNATLADIYWQFSKAAPSGELNLSYGAKNVQTPIDFTMMCPVGSKSYGFYINVPRS